MSLDDEVRSFERTPLRSGQDPRAVAAKLLGVDPDRFWLLVDAWGEDEPAWVVSSESQAAGLRRRRKMTGITGPQSWLAVYAIPVVALEEASALLEVFRSRGMVVRLWDRVESAQVVWFGLTGSFSRIRSLEEGWREPNRWRILNGARPSEIEVSFVDAEGRETRAAPLVEPSNIVVDQASAIEVDHNGIVHINRLPD